MYTPEMVVGTVLPGWEYAANGSALPDGCPAPVAKDTYVIGMSQANKAEPWREAMDSQIAAAAAAYPEFEVVFQDAAQDNAKQVSDVENLLTQGIDLLIISPERGGAAERDRQAGVGELRAGDRARPQPGGPELLDVHRGGQCGDRAWGRAVCGQVVRGERAGRVPDREIRGLEGAPPAKDRGDGFRMGLADEGLSEDNIIFSQNADWLRERAVPAAAAAFQSNPDIDVLYGHNDPMAEGAYIAAQDAGIDVSQVLFIGIDALPTPDGGIMSVLEGRLGVTFVYPTGGKQAIDWAHLILTQAVVPPRWVVLPFDTVSPDNAQDVCNSVCLSERAVDPRYRR